MSLADVNKQNLIRPAQQYPHTRKVVNFRKIYDHADEFDAAVVSDLISN